MREPNPALLFDGRDEGARLFGRVRGDDEDGNVFQRGPLQALELEQLLQARRSPRAAREREKDEAPAVLVESDRLSVRVGKRDRGRRRSLGSGREREGDRDRSQDQSRHESSIDSGRELSISRMNRGSLFRLSKSGSRRARSTT